MIYSRQQDFLIQNLSTDLTAILVEEQSKSIEQALNIVYNSITFEKICDVRTGLYQESAGYNYDMLQDELRYGKFGKYGKYD